MKNVAIFAACLVLAFSLSGCVLFQDVAKAAAAAEQSRVDFEKAGLELKDAYERLQRIKSEYDSAVKAGDKDKITALLDAGAKAMAEYESANRAYETTKSAVMSAVKKVEDAEGANKYLIGILSAIGGALSILGVAVPKFAQAGRLAGGLFRVIAAADKHIPAEAYGDFAKEVSASLSPKQFATVNAAAGVHAIDPNWQGATK